jgi:hypothetical protein
MKMQSVSQLQLIWAHYMPRTALHASIVSKFRLPGFRMMQCPLLEFNLPSQVGNGVPAEEVNNLFLGLIQNHTQG